MWESLTHDPQRQAAETAEFCIQHAPHLAEALGQKILANLPDSRLKQLLFKPTSLELDGRIVALNNLAQCKASYVPDPNRQIQAAARFLKQKPKAPSKSYSPNRAATETYKQIFGVKPTILPVHKPKLIRVDWEMGRLAVILQRAHQFRLWILSREITRSADGSGVIHRRVLWQNVQACSIEYTKRHFNRLLKDGEGLFWHCAGKKIYISGIQPVARDMTWMAEEQAIPTETNLPGNREVLLDLSGSLEQWEGMLYAGWIAGRSLKGKWDVTISREVLSSLFGRDETTIRRWETTRLYHILHIRQNVAQYAGENPHLGDVPDHAQPYVARINTTASKAHEVRLMWQLPNTYHAEIISHSHKGQAAKVRKAVQSTDDPADNKSGGQNRRYFQSPKKLKARHHSRKFRMGLLGDVNRKVYVYLGTHRNSKRGVFEYTAEKHPITHPDERESMAWERDYFDGEGAVERQFWVGRREHFID